MTTEKSTITRRNILRTSIAAAGVALLKSGQAFASQCVATPAQAEGPYYPVAHRLEEDNDLTWRHDRNKRAGGQVIGVVGQVTDDDCQPVPRALVEIWQACASGRYDHPNDENPAPLDDNFQYWGRTVTDIEGTYRFTTVKPGAYPDSLTWIRPPHIHFRVHRLGFHELTTQMYFAGEYYNDYDRILQKLPEHERRRLVIKPDVSGRVPVYCFDVALLSV